MATSTGIQFQDRKDFINITNSSGTTLNAGDVVIWKATAAAAAGTVAFDATTNYDGATSTSHTQSHTTSGSNRYLFVHLAPSSGNDVVSSVTYAGIAMTRIDTVQVTSSLRIFSYYLIAPASGANNVVVTLSSSQTLSMRIASYTGVHQSSPHDATKNTTASNGANLVLTLTTTTPNSWLVTGARSFGTAFSTGASTTIRTSTSLSDVVADSNAALAAGSHSLTLVTGGSSSSAGIVVAIRPAAAIPESRLDADTTTTAGDDKVLGMAVETIASGMIGRVQRTGKTTLLKVNGTTAIAVGDFIATYTTAKIGKKAIRGDMAFAIALEAYSTADSNGVIDAVLIEPRPIDPAP